MITLLSILFAVAAAEPPPAPGIADWGFRREIAEGVDATGVPVMPKGVKPWLENRISRCFFGPIKRPPFNRDELMDDIDYYPDAYLAQLRDEGVNGLWLTIEFRDLVETSFNHRHPTAAKRLAKLRRTVGKCAEYGIGVWVFAIEPRCGKAAPEFYEANTNLFARAYWPPCDDWDHLMCPSKPGTRRYLKEAMKDLFTQVPGLKGFMNISHGERWTTCLSTFPSSEIAEQCPQLCEVCSKREPWQILNDILEPMRDGIREVNPEAGFISWFYMAEMSDRRSEWVYDCVRHFPKGVSFQFNFESGVVREQEGRPRVGGDYWLAQPGPSDIFRRISEIAREAGTRLSAKIQVSTSHEMATVPYVPVPGLLYRKFRAMKECGVKDAMYCWYFGCNPGLMNRAAGMLACEDFRGGEDEFLDRLARADWGEDAPKMSRLWKKFSDAYSNYPLSNMMQYYGPFHDGVVWELHPDLDLMPLSRSWVRDRADGDTIGECLEGFELDDACALAERMCAELEGAGDLDELSRKYAADVRRSRELGVMKAFRILCLSGRDILKFYRARREAVTASRTGHDHAVARRHVAEMRRLAEAARGYSAEMIPLCEKDSRLGFHSEAETYKFHPALLRWRIGQLDRVLARIDRIDAELSGGNPYPESEFERRAPVYRVEREASGGMVVDGEALAGDSREVEIDLYDATGSSYPVTFRVKPENGRFRKVVPAGDWGWIRIVRPGMPAIPAADTAAPVRLKLMTRSIHGSARLVERAERSAFRFYNICPAVVGGEAELAREMSEYRRETGNDTVLYALSVAPMIAPASEKAGVLVESWKKFAAECRRTDPQLKPGVLFQSLLGHYGMFGIETDRRDPWTRMVSFEGGANRFCLLDPGFREYLRGVVRAVAEAHPAFVLTDDDCRNMRECFCDRHAELYNAATGRKLDGEGWRSYLGTLPVAHPDLQAVKGVMIDYVKSVDGLVRSALDEVDPSIEGGVCEGGEEYFNSGAFAQAIAAKGQRPVCRLSSGLYLEQQRGEYAFQDSLCRVQTLFALHEGEPVDFLDEADTFPQNLWSRSAVGWHTHLVQAAMIGLRGAKVWFVNATRPQQGPVPKAYTKLLAENRGLYRELARAVEGTKPVGVITPVAKHPGEYDIREYCWANFPRDQHTWAQGTLTHFGVPVVTRCGFAADGIYELAGSNSVARLHDDELKAVLSHRVLVDGRAAIELQRRGFGELIGVEVAERAPAFTFEEFPDTKEKCGPLRNADHVPGLSMHDGAEAVTWLMYGRFFEDGEYQAYPENLTEAKRAAPGAVFYRNALGGRVLTTAYGDYVTFYARFSAARKRWLDRLLAKLNGGPLDYTVLNGQDTAVLARRTPDGATALVTVFNFNLEPIEQLEMTLRDRPRTVEILAADGTWHPVEFSFMAGRLRFAAKMNSWGVVTLRIAGGPSPEFGK